MLKYYLKDGSREKGPFVLDDLKYQRIRPDTLVKVDDGDWKPVSAVDDLRFLLQLNNHKHNSEPTEVEAAARKRVAVTIAVAILIAAMGMAMFFFSAPN